MKRDNYKKEKYLTLNPGFSYDIIKYKKSKIAKINMNHTPQNRNYNRKKPAPKPELNERNKKKNFIKENKTYEKNNYTEK